LKQQITRVIVFLAASTILAACSTSNSAPPTTSNPAQPGSNGYSTLQFSAGILTVAGVGTGVNLVSTMRHGGASAVLVDTPTFTGPFDLTCSLPTSGCTGMGFTTTTGNAGVVGTAGPPGDTYVTAFSPTPSGVYLGAPSAYDASLNQLSGTPQTLHPGAPSCDSTAASVPAPYVSCAGALTTPSNTTFGYSGGIFANGLQPGNYNEFSKPYVFSPYPIPLFATTAVTQFLPYGGPPAFDDGNNGLGYRDGQHSTLVGAITGMTAVQLPQVVTSLSGTYSLSVVVPTGGSSTTTIGPSTSAVSAAHALPVITAPTLTLDGKGGATVTVPAFPAGVTQEYVFVIDQGPTPAAAGSSGDLNCQGATFGTAEAPVYYTLVYTAPGTYAVPATAPTGGATNVGLPDTIGPNVNQTSATSITGSPSICTGADNTTAVGASTPGDTYQVYGVGMDYDLYDAMVPKSKIANPTIRGAAGQSDMTISAPTTGTSP
jgi:hypothetical protein